MTGRIFQALPGQTDRHHCYFNIYDSLLKNLMEDDLF